MMARCYDPKNKAFKWYGALGVRVCERWHVFANFVADMGVPPSRLHTVDRKEPSGDYSPENCEWQTWRHQRLNRRPTANALSASR